MKVFPILCGISLGAMLSLTSQAQAPVAPEKPLLEAEALMKNGKPADAYGLLEPLDFARSGEVRFDYLLGIAALDSGKADKATIAFERVLAVDPNFAGARLDLARAYYQLGDLARAKAEFATVLTQNPPPEARATIQKYLDAIDAYERALLTRSSAYVEGIMGRDNNVASATSQTFTFVPNSPWSGLFPGNQLPPAATLQDRYRGFNAGAEISHSLNAQWGLFAGIDVRGHANANQTAYDSQGLTGRFGTSYQAAQSVYKLSFNDGLSTNADTMRLHSLGINAEWQHVFNPTNQLSAFVQYGQNRASGYPATSPTTDARIEGDTNQVVLGTGAVQVLGDGKRVLFESFYFGRETDVAPIISLGLPEGGRTDGPKRFMGLRVGAQASLSEALDAVVSLGWQSATYDQQNKLIMNRRSERLYDLSMQLNWHFAKLWTLKPQIAFSKKDSNIALYSFARSDLSVTLRRDFK